MSVEAQKELSPETQASLDVIYQQVFNQLANGGTEDTIIASLIEGGLDERTSKAIYDNAVLAHNEAHLKKANKDILYGALWCGGGSLITLITYSAASEGGGSYVVTWGAIIFGGVQLIKGLINRNKYS